MYCHTSHDGLKFSPSERADHLVFRIGKTGTLDESQVRPGAAIFHDNLWWLFYEGQDSTTASRIFSSLGQTPRKLLKVGNMRDLGNFGSPAQKNHGLVYACSGDLSFGPAPSAMHTLDRGLPGYVNETARGSFPVSFTFHLQAIGAAGIVPDADDTSDEKRLWQKLFDTPYAINAGPSFENASEDSFHLLYRILDEAGSDLSLVLFPQCTANLEGLAEDAERPSTTEVRCECHGVDEPIVAKY
jgi:hypothetical protein